MSTISSEVPPNAALPFPDPLLVEREMSEQLQRLSLEQQDEAIRDVLLTGDMLLRDAPNRSVLDQMFLRREEEWQRIQRELFSIVLSKETEAAGTLAQPCSPRLDV